MNMREVLAEYNLKRGFIPTGYVVDGTAYFDSHYLGEVSSPQVRLNGLYSVPGYGIILCKKGKWIEPDFIIWREE